MKKGILSFAIMFAFLALDMTIQLYGQANKEKTGKLTFAAMKTKGGDDLVNIGLDEKNRRQMSGNLTEFLGNEYIVYVKTQNFHWNVVGKHFGPLHELFGNQYEMLAKFIDRIAERIRALGFKTIGSLSEFKQFGTIQEDITKELSEQEMLATLLKDHETIIRDIRTYLDVANDINDKGTDNMLAELLEQHEKIAWMLRAHLLGK